MSSAPEPTERPPPNLATYVGVVMAAVCLLTPQRALASGGPFTWEGIVCKAGAFADIEVVLGDSKTRKKHRQRLIEIVGSASDGPIKPVNLTVLHGDFALRAGLARSSRGQRDVDRVLASLLGSILKEGRYVIRAPLVWNPHTRTWTPQVTANATLHRVNYHAHPDFHLWWSKVGPIWREKETAARSKRELALCEGQTSDPPSLKERAWKAQANPDLAMPK